MFDLIHQPNLHWAASQGDVDLMSRLLADGHPVDATTDGFEPHHLMPPSPDTPAGRAAVIGALTKNRVVNRLKYRGFTPLMICAVGDELAAARALVDAGAALEIEEIMGRTALSLAAQNGSAAVLTLLIDRGAKIHTVDSAGDQPIHNACRAGATETVKLLLAAGADAVSTNKQGQTALFLAAAEGAEIFSAVLARLKLLPAPLIHFTVNRKCRGGSTPLHQAAASGSVEDFCSLLELGAQPDQITDKGSTVLMEAACHGNLETVRYILTHKLVDIHATDRAGRNALFLALIQGHKEIGALLLEAGCQNLPSATGKSVSIPNTDHIHHLRLGVRDPK